VLPILKIYAKVDSRRNPIILQNRLKRLAVSNKIIDNLLDKTEAAMGFLFSFRNKTKKIYNKTHIFL
jgi:hypothetical protein